MRRSRMSWAIGIVAPWCLAVGLIVSVTADAGQNASIGGSYARQSSWGTAEPQDLIPVADLGGGRGQFNMAAAPRLLPVVFDLGTKDEFKQIADETEPRLDLKRRDGAAPNIDRGSKGDPAIGLRPTFTSRLRNADGLVAAQILSPHDDASPAASFSLQDEGRPLDGATSFAPWAAGEDMQEDAEAVTSGAAAIAMRPAALKERLAQGATPKVSRAEALSSTTPAPADGAPIAVMVTPRQAPLPGSTVVARVDEHREYAALLTGEHGERERKCLAEAVYFEARSEPEEGQAAVAQVVLNRARSGLYPASICGVVYQNRSHYKACQFSFACEGRSLRVTEPEAWHTAVRIAAEVLDGRTYLSDVGGATHYHANYVRPGWARRLVKMDVIGHHVFYKLRNGQT